MADEKEVDFKQLEALCRSYMRLEDCAAYLRVSGRTIERRIRETYDQTFVEYREAHFTETRHTLIQIALDRAINKGSDKMLIKCLENLCGWKMPVTFNPTANTTITLNYNLDDNDVDKPVEKIVEPSPPEQIPEDTTGSGS